MRHREVTGAVHDEGGAIALQVLHAGRYGYHPFSVSASRKKSPITPFRPSALSTRGVDRTATDFAASVALAGKAGYDAVEIMGSEGYLINQFLAARTNDRTDRWGGSAENRMRFPVEIVRRTRELVGADFPIVYRISLLDLVEGGQTWDEVVELAHLLEEAGVTVLNTGIGWHEARVPTIITQVPPGAWRSATARLKAEVSVPVCASNRINTPELAESILAAGEADLVSMARPLLADPDFVNKAAAGRADEINTCIACNQACLDHVFQNQQGLLPGQPARLPRDHAGAARPTTAAPSDRSRSSAPGPAGLAAAVSAAERGFAVTLFERAGELGGQFRLAMRVPGKEDFRETLRYYTRRLEVLGVDVRLGTEATAADLAAYDEVVVATGVVGRVPDLAGVDHPKVVSYADVLSGAVVPGRRVAVIGAGGIGVDVSHFLTHDPADGFDDWMAHWGVGDPAVHPGGLTERKPRTPVREVTLLQRKTTPIGAGLGKTSGLGAPRGAQAVGRRPGERRDLRPRRRRRAARHGRRRAAGVRRRPRRALRRARSRCAGCTTTSSRPAGRRPAPDRRRRRGRRARRQAGDRAGHAGRRRPLMPAGRRVPSVPASRVAAGARFTPVIVDLSDEEARAALPLKWGAVEPGVVPTWVAEMDYALAPPLVDALTAAVRRGTAGYPPFGDGGVGAALTGYADRHWSWSPPADASVVVGDVIAGIRIALEVLCPPGPVVVPLPCYPPFRDVVAIAGRELVAVELDPDADDAALDLAAVEDAFRAGARTLLLCNPHNPLGRVATPDELVALAALARRYDARVIADEIHGPLVLPGATFTPYLSLDERGILVTSPSKTFNTAGLHCAQVVTLDPAEQARLRGVPLPQNHAYSPLGMIAAVVAWTDGDDWNKALVERLDAQRTLLGELLAGHLPDARMRPLEATYLPWLDLRAYGHDDPATLALRHGVRVGPGEHYQPGLAGHVRLNIATDARRLEQIVERLAAAVA